MRPCGTFDSSYAQDMAICRTRFQWVMLIAFLLFLFGVLPQISGNYVLGVISLMGITIIAALGLNILTGYCGQISLGHAAFVGVGAFTSAILTNHLGWSWWATVPCAAFVTVLVGLIFALPALRVKGFYLALATLAGHFIITWAILHGDKITGGAAGLIVGVPKLGNITINTEKEFFFLIMGFTVALTFIAKNLVRGKLGRNLIAIRDNDIAAGFMGVDIFRYKLIAFAIASAYAGIAGSLLAPYFGSVLIEQFPLMDSIWYIAYIIVGGMGSITGTIFGVAFLKLLTQGVMMTGPIIGNLFPAISGTIVSSMLLIVFGVVIILFMIFEPRGLYHRWEIAKSSFRVWPYSY